MVRVVTALMLCLTLQSPAKSVHAGNIDVVRTIVHAWARAWESRDIEHYMSFYSPSFRSKGFYYQGWKAQKSQTFKRSQNIRVEISDLWVFIEGQRARASFVQRYYDQNVLDVGEKKLILVKAGGTWKIISEEWKPLTTSAQPTQKKAATKSFDKLDNSNQKKLHPDQRPKIKGPLVAVPVKALDKKTAVRNIEKRDASAQKVPQPDQDSENEDYPKEKYIVKSVTFKTEKASEKVFLKLNRFTIPRILTLEGDRPRIVVDVRNVSFWSGPSKISVNGKLIRQIRTHLHRDIEKLRVVLDLNPADNYIIDQTFFKKDNVYCIEVR